jgi:hypothetical protein
MSEIVSIKEGKRGSRTDYDWGLALVLKKRKALLRTVPIMSDQLTEIDKWLATQPGLPIKILIDIWSRASFCFWVQYGDASPEVKHIMLIRLRESYWEFCQLPLRYQKKLWPMGWERWHAEFEEEEEAANGAA